MSKVFVTLKADELEALVALAARERRAPRDQAALIVRRGLEQAGLLPGGGQTIGFSRCLGCWARIAATTDAIGRVIVPVAISVLIDVARTQMRQRGLLP